MIDSSTHLYCVFGNPVKHSKSPVIHNAFFHKHHINAVYLAVKIDAVSKLTAAIKLLNIKGASITLPFKESIMAELDWIDKDALHIGAVNTIMNQKGKLHGYNTDYKAAIAPLKPFGIKNKRVCLIGAGGAARAIAFGVKKEKGDLVIINRNKNRGNHLALKYQAEFIPLEDLSKMDVIKADIIINTTSIGMYPDFEGSAFPSVLLDSHMIVMDIVYNPLTTKLLSQAQKKGCTIIDGLSMFIHQGASQFKIWTGITADIEGVRDIIMNGNI